MLKLPTITSENRPDASSPLLTEAGARRLGDRRMPKDLKAAGFRTEVYRAIDEVNGWNGYRVSYGKRVAA